MMFQPKGIGELLDNTFSLYKRQFKSYVTFAAVGFLLNMLLNIMELVFGLNLVRATGITIIVILGIMIVSFVIWLSMDGGLIKKAAEQILEREISNGEAYRFGFRKSGKIFLSYLLYGIIVMIGLLLLIIPGIYLMFSFALARQALIIEGVGAWTALKRSRQLIKGSWWRVTWFIFLISAITIILIYVPFLILAVLNVWMFGAGLHGQIVNLILVTIVSCLVVPIPVIACTLLYYDLKVRKENFDIHTMVDNLTEAEMPHSSEE
ncbi:MAG: hypothetical protein H6Q67_438 [Firmicutes bacterium]|nr:hypothetical protein [Bacillota bacterium]